MTRRLCLRQMATIIALVASSLLTATPAHAQKNNKPAANTGPAAADPRQNPGNSVSVEIAKAEGKYEGMFQSTMKMSTSDKKELFLDISPVTSVKYSAEAEVGWLAPGQMVRFSAVMDRGKIVGPLKALEVFIPVMSMQLSPDKMREQTPGVYQEGKGIGDPRVKPAAPAQAAPAGSQKVRVVAQLQAVQKNSLSLAAGQQPLLVDLDPNAKITVTASELQMIATSGLLNNGDGVVATGTRNTSQPQLAQRISVEILEIKAAKKLKQQVVATNPKGKRPNSRTKDADAKAASKDGKDGKPGQTPDGKPATTKPK